VTRPHPTPCRHRRRSRRPLPLLALLAFQIQGIRPAPSSSVAAVGSFSAVDTPSADDIAPTLVYARNLLLRKGPNFRIYIRWIRGQMVRTRRQVNPSFDDPESFILQIQKGVIHANIGDISNYLNASSPTNAPLKNISIQPEGYQLKLHGTIHKIVRLTIELVGTLSPTPDGRVQFHVTKLNVLKIPLKGLLGGFHVELADLVHASNIPGVQIVDNDISARRNLVLKDFADR